MSTLVPEGDFSPYPNDSIMERWSVAGIIVSNTSNKNDIFWVNYFYFNKIKHNI